MISVKFNNKAFMKDMNNLVEYSAGFLQGVEQGKPIFLAKLGAGIKEILESYIDSNANVSPETLQHVYEWYMTGSPNARLFDITYKVIGPGLSFGYSFRQSSVVKAGSNVPFYDKARIMEEGIAVTIAPRNSSVLAFEDNGETVFSSSPITVSNPGGTGAQGGFDRTFNAFFDRYFSQAFLQSSGLIQYFKSPVAYKRNLSRGLKVGRSVGVTAGYEWISKAGEVV